MSDQLIPISAVVNEVGKYLAKDLYNKGITATCIDNIIDAKNTSVIKFSIGFNTAERVLEDKEFSKVAEEWAKHLAVHIVAPFPLITYKMQLPKDTDEAALTIIDGICILASTEYLLEEKRIVTSFTICAKFGG